jgi:hypothetical protein
MRIILFFISIIFIVSCGDSNKIEEFKMSDNLLQNIKTVAKSRIFFGHQSVGGNILDGLKKIDNENKINLITKDNMDNLPESFFMHFKIGENEKPKTKCDDFVGIIDSIHNNIDYAFMKICYIDINRNSDVEALFEYYKSNMDTLIKKYPEVTFLHLTSPLRFNAKGFGVWIRELLGRPNNSKLDNVKRNEYNDLLKSYYPEDTIFDLAAAQSTYPNGKKEYFTMDGEKYYSLIEEYTNDGGHLTELGSKVVAQELINKLGNIINKISN